MFSFLPEDSPTITAGVASTCCFFSAICPSQRIFISMPFQHQNNTFYYTTKNPLSPYIPTPETCFSYASCFYSIKSRRRDPKSSVNPSKFPGRVVGGGAPRYAWGRPSPRPSTHAQTLSLTGDTKKTLLILKLHLLHFGS